MGFAIATGKSVCTNRKYAMHVLVAALALLLVTIPAFSQGSQGAIQGSVFDQSGGAVAGASVSVIDVARGVTRALVSDAAGEYVATNLNPGTYTIRAEAKGFRTVEHSGILVEVGQNIRVDLVVQPGEQTQTITVTGEVPAINTTDSTLGGTVNNDAVNSLPLNGRNFERLLQLRPGVVTAVGSSTGAMSTNGRRTGHDVLLVEGIAAISQTVGTTVLNSGYRGGDAASILPIDSIQEFNTEQNPKAEYGWKEGSVINVGVKSGTNSLHGTAYAFGRDASATDAGNPFRATGVSPVTPATLEQFGASAGGRIIKDKLFWFASYEGLRATLGDVSINTIPESISTGDPTRSMVDACNTLKSTGKTISPLSAQISGLNTATCVVSPSSATFENLFPFNPTTSTSYAPPLTNNLPLDNGLFKADYVIGARHRLNGMYYASRSTQLVNYASQQLQAPAPLPATAWEASVPQNVQMYAGDWTWTPSSTWVNNFRLGYAVIKARTIPGDGDINAADPWPTGYGINTGSTAPRPAGGGMPNITITGFSGWLGAGPRSASRGPEGDVDLSESVSYLHGKHAFKFGFEHLYVVYDGVTADQSNGLIPFSSLQNFLQGIVAAGGTIQGGNPAFNARAHWYTAFAQDDWRLTPRLTVNLGLRFEYQGSLRERNNNLSNFDPTVNALTTPAVLAVGPGAPIPHFPAQKGVWPRLGAAWDVQGNGKTVVRAGAGLMENAENGFTFINLTPYGANFPDIGVNNSGTFANAHTTWLLSPAPCVPAGPSCAGSWNWSTTGPIFPIGQAQVIKGVSYTGPTCTAVSPCSSGSVTPNLRAGFSSQWNLDIQRAITNNLTVDVAYVGVHGYREIMWTDVNQPPLGVGWTAAAVSSCLASAPLYGNCKPDAAVEKAARPYNIKFPYLSYISQAGQGGWSNYNGLQVTAQARNYHGLSFISGYTYAHALDTSSNLNPNSVPIGPDGTNFRVIYANSNNDVRHRFTFAPRYLIPGTKSPGQMLEGWSVSGIMTLQAGLPWFPNDATKNDWLGTGENNQTANSLSGVIQPWNYSGPRSAFTSGPTSIPCFGKLTGCTPYAVVGGAPQPPAECVTAAQAPYGGNAQLQGLAFASLVNFGCYEQGGGILTPPALGTIGNATRNVFTGPHYYNLDLSIGKDWKIVERVTVEFRTEFFNILNHADFSTPSTTGSSGTPLSGINGTSSFGCGCSTPDSGNPVLGSGGPRHIQFGLKLIY
jgi:hypothetical protein